MKVTFNKKDLMAALKPAAGISQTKNTYYACDGLLFECPPNKNYGDYDLDDPNLCRISAFDLEKGLRTTIKCKVHDKGMYVLNTQYILQIVRALPDGDVTVDIDKNGVAKISDESVNFKITAASGENFPAMPMFIGTKTYRIPEYKVRKLIGETVFAVAQNDQRAAFNGGFFKINDGELTVVGCDNSKLAASKCSITDTNDAPEDAEMIIPGKFLGELMRLIKDTEDELTMIIGRKHVIFKIGGIYFFTRMLETEYPAYEKMLPETAMTQVCISRAAFVKAVERASIITEAKLGGGGGSFVKLEFGNNAVTVSSVSSSGEIEENLSADIDGADITIGFNCRNLLETLKAIPADCDMLRLKLNTPLMGILIEPMDGTKNSNMFMYFVLPWRMNSPKV